MLKLLFVLFGLLFVQQASAQQCTETGGYPWLVQSCLHSSDLNKIVALNAGPSPPHNSNNQGALPRTLWLDTSTTPNTLRFCKANPCFSFYDPTQWASWATVDASTGLINFLNQATNLTLRRIDTGIADLITSTDAIIAWYSATTAGKTENLPACSSANKGESHIVADGVGNAGTYPITLTPTIGNTLSGGAVYALSQNHQAVSIVCNGVSDWTVYAGHNEILASFVTINGHVLSLGGSLVLTPSDIETLALVTTTGTIGITALHTVWQPGSTAATTFQLPASPVARDRHTVQNMSNGSAALTVSGNGGNILNSYGSLTTFVLPNRGDFAEFEYIGSSNWVVR
jgi:hypothetical protein